MRGMAPSVVSFINHRPCLSEQGGSERRLIIFFINFLKKIKFFAGLAAECHSGFVSG